jgi:hypothetical protein
MQLRDLTHIIRKHSNIYIHVKTLMYMSNVQYYTIIEKQHKCNWSFGHQSQQKIKFNIQG